MSDLTFDRVMLTESVVALAAGPAPSVPLSNRYRIVGSIDRPDWLAELIWQHAPIPPAPATPEARAMWRPAMVCRLGDAMDWAIGLGRRNAIEFYCRCLSSAQTGPYSEDEYRAIKRTATAWRQHAREWRAQDLIGLEDALAQRLEVFMCATDIGGTGDE